MTLRNLWLIKQLWHSQTYGLMIVRVSVSSGAHKNHKGVV